MSSGNFLFLFLMALGPILSISSSNWLICWVGIEVTFLGLIPLLVSSESSFFSLSKESSMKYFCIQALGSGLLLFSGIINFMLSSEITLFSLIVFLVSLMIKLGVFPAHFWVPSVVSGLSIFSMFLVLTWQKIVPFFLLINFLDVYREFHQIILMLGGMSAIVGALIGLNQTQIGPMLGASSITHGGWLLLGSVYGSLWIYFLIYCFNFLILVYFLWMKDSMVSGMMILSLSGLPPFIMFIGKWSILSIALMEGAGFWYLIFPILGSVMSLFFYLKFFYSFYLEEKFSSMKSFACLGLSCLVGLVFITMF
nr:NADH dehydrogenase subunit 2 [Phestilla sp. CUS-2023]